MCEPFLPLAPSHIVRFPLRFGHHGRPYVVCVNQGDAVLVTVLRPAVHAASGANRHSRHSVAPAPAARTGAGGSAGAGSGSGSASAAGAGTGEASAGVAAGVSGASSRHGAGACAACALAAEQDPRRGIASPMYRSNPTARAWWTRLGHGFGADVDDACDVEVSPGDFDVRCCMQLNVALCGHRRFGAGS